MYAGCFRFGGLEIGDFRLIQGDGFSLTLSPPERYFFVLGGWCLGRRGLELHSNSQTRIPQRSFLKRNFNKKTDNDPNENPKALPPSGRQMYVVSSPYARLTARKRPSKNGAHKSMQTYATLSSP